MWLELGPQMLVASGKEGLISSMQALVLGRIQGDPILHSALTTSRLFRLPTFAWSKWVSASGALGCGGFVFKICGPANVALSPWIFPRGWFCLGYISCMFCPRLCPVKLRCVHLPMANRFAKLDLKLLWLPGISLCTEQAETLQRTAGIGNSQADNSSLLGRSDPCSR